MFEQNEIYPRFNIFFVLAIFLIVAVFFTVCLIVGSKIYENIKKREEERKKNLDKNFGYLEKFEKQNQLLQQFLES